MAFPITEEAAPLPPDWLGAASCAWWAWQQAQWQANWQAQCQALLAWQAAARSWQQDLLDAWAVHWGGGAPID